MLRRRLLTLLPFAALVAGPVLLLSARAGAEITGPCTATMNGVDVNTIDTPGTALEVPYDGTITIEVQSSGEITGHVVKLEPVGGVAFTADEGADDGNGWSGTVDVADYATYGVGIYKVTGEATGPGACSGTAYVNVTGKNPLTTVAGAVGLAMTVVGAVGVGASALAVRGKVRHDAELQFSKATPGRQPELGPGQGPNAGMCTRHMLSVFGLTLAYMVSGAGVPGAAAVPPIRSRPYVSVWGSIWSVLFGLGTIVLAQQFAVLYPTLVLTIVWIVVCVLLGGLLAPSLVALSTVRSANARLAAGATTAGAQASTPVSTSAWLPTHRTPAGGLDAYPAPDPGAGGPIRLDPGLQLRVEQTTGDWAQVTASNGWTGWVDARRLEGLG